MAAISGKFLQTNGTTQITDQIFDLQMLDFANNPVGSVFPSLANGKYSFIPSGLPTDKRMGLTVSLAGTEKTRVTGINGNPQAPETVDILVPGVTQGQQQSSYP